MEGMMDKKDLAHELRIIKQDYAFDPDDIMSQDDERVRKLKQIINTRLSVEDRTIILLYIDQMSYRKLGNMFNVSHMTIRRDVRRIIDIILAEYQKSKK